MSSNTIVITSRLGNDPDAKNTNSGTAVSSFSLPVDVGWGDSKETEWVRVSVFGKRAENCNQYLRKGSLVTVVGTLEKTWVNDKGKATIQMTAERVDFLSDFGKQEQTVVNDYSEVPF